MAKLSDFFSNQSFEGNSFSSQNENNTKKVSQEDLQEKFNMYKDMSKQELNSALASEVARQKSAGTFDFEGLEKMVNSLEGSLSQNEFQNIKRLLDGLK